jgi:tripartite-type tricarboxylate transporter receptor subunit TctC
MRLRAALLALVVLGVAVAGALGQAPFAGRTVVVLVGNPPGGGYDRFARIVARHLPRYLPGNPAVVVQNMPGAGGIVAANHLFNVARTDAYTLGLFNRNLVIAQLAGVQELRVDMRRWNWIGNLAAETYVFAIRSDLPYRHVLELRRADPPLAVGSTGPGTGSHDYPLALKAFLRLNLRIISGYQGTGEVALAVERRELDGRAGAWSSLLPHIQRGLLRPLVRTLSDNPEPQLRALPVDQDLATGDVARAVLRLRSITLKLGRPFVAAPGAPGELVRLYQEAFRRLAQDAAFRSEIERNGFEPAYTSPEECLRIMQEVLSAPPGLQRVFRELFQFGE